MEERRAKGTRRAINQKVAARRVTTKVAKVLANLKRDKI